MRTKYSEMETKLIALDVPTLAYYADYFQKKMADIMAVPLGGRLMSMEISEDHQLEVFDYYRGMYQFCSEELLERRESIFGPEPEDVFGRLINGD